MENPNEIKQLISEAKNICLIPNENEPESLTSGLALFYTLKELNKNVNLIVENFPEKLNFLIPSLDFIANPKNLVISIPNEIADVSQVYYEKNEDSLKINLTLDKGYLKKEHIAFYFKESKPDLIIALGIQNFQKQLVEKLNSFGFLLDCPILNIDNNPDNKKFGQINIIGQKSVSELTFDFIKNSNGHSLSEGAANCLLTGLVIHYENFQSPKTNPAVFELAAELTKKGALPQKITGGLFKTTPLEVKFLGKVFQNLKTDNSQQISWSLLEEPEFSSFGKTEANWAIEKIKTIGFKDSLLVLWPSHSSQPVVKGFFYSNNNNLIKKLAESQQQPLQDNWLFLSFPGSNVNETKEVILKIIG